MSKSTPLDPEREDRITMEIVVDAYNSDECAMGWYCYLENTLVFPFTATRRRKDAAKSPRKVTVIGLADADDCRGGIRVEIESGDDTFDVPPLQLDVVEADDATRQAVADWHYWKNRGYSW